MTHKTYKKPIVFFLALAAVLVVGGYVAALNGWFGGGAAIPEDTMTRGLVGYWNFDEGGGQTAKDLSGNGNNGTLGAAVADGTDDPLWSKGKIGGALSFDGVDDYVDAGNNASVSSITSAITIEAWVYLDSTSFDFNTHLEAVGKAGYDGSDQYQFGVNNTRTLNFWSEGGPDQNSTGLINLNAWQHIAVTYNKSKVYFYINGVLDSSFNGTGGLSSDGGNDLVLGTESKDLSYGDSFKGLLDEVRIYNRALSAEEVRYHYNRGGPVAEWKFDEGSGTTIYDSTENNKDGTLHE
jgi:hypothetical protein